MKTIQIIEATNYLIAEDGKIYSKNNTEKAISENKGFVRLTIGKQRKLFKVADVFTQYFGVFEEPMTKETKLSLEKAAKEADAIETTKEIKKAKKAVAKIDESKTEKLPSGAQVVRDAYDADPENFSCKEYVESKKGTADEISYQRVWGAIKKHIANLKKTTDNEN